jgi:hypothetical protein
VNEETRIERRSGAGFLLFSLVMAAVIMASAKLAHGMPKGSAMRIALALIEGLASSLVIVGMMRSLRHVDELQRRIFLEGLALAFAGTGVLATTYGFLVNAGLPDIDWGAFVWPAMMALWVLGMWIARRRYR